jgi:hypothetical protein
MSKPITPLLAMGATILYYTDRKAATITHIQPSGKRVTVRVDRSIRTDSNGQSEAQSYAYEFNPNGEQKHFSLRSNGLWVEVGARAENGLRLGLGYRDTYHDYGF